MSSGHLRTTLRALVNVRREPPSQLQLLQYPANDLPMDPNHLGIGAHSDFECFTILRQQALVNLGQERYSMPLFFAVDYHTRVSPLPAFVDSDNPAHYGGIVAGDHLVGFSINPCKQLRKRVLAGDLKIDFPIHHENPFKRRAIDEAVPAADPVYSG